MKQEFIVMLTVDSLKTKTTFFFHLYLVSFNHATIILYFTTQTSSFHVILD